MIRELQRDDINKVSDIWLDTNNEKMCTMRKSYGIRFKA